jgi:Cu/Zn superoxide dismutase
MSKISRRGLRITAAAAGAGVIAVAAWATTAHAATSAMAASQVSTRVQLAPMPQGTVTYIRNSRGEVDITVSAFGLTPGSVHRVELVNRLGAVAIFHSLTANSAGQARGETLDSRYTGPVGSMRIAILNGDGMTPVTLPAIARTGGYDTGRRTYQLMPTETGEGGTNYGTPQGTAVIAYDQSKRTISVTVSASGLTPGAHAAHIHLGSCNVQGPIQYGLADFIANARGQIVDQTRVVTHVATPLPASGWYFNLHQGNSGDIVANGRPTINFRPLLCADIKSVG